MSRSPLRADPAAAWTAYWQSADARGCLPRAGAGLDRVFRNLWQHFALQIPPGSRVLDVATGNGIVPRWMQAVRSDLAYLGVDYATDLPRVPDGLQLLGGVDITCLPFAGGEFAAITSQFGIEYAPLTAALAEVGRTLRPGGRAVFISHCEGSPIEASSRARHADLQWAVECFSNAGDRASLASGISEATSRFGQSSPAWEIAHALEAALKGPDASAWSTLRDELLARAGSESDRLAMQLEAARQANDENAWEQAADAAQLALVERMDVHGPGTKMRPVAHLRSFVLR